MNNILHLKLKISIFCLTFFVALSGCDNNETKEIITLKHYIKNVKSRSANKIDQIVMVGNYSDYQYRGLIKRDPFLPLSTQAKRNLTVMLADKTGLQLYEIHQLKMRGTLHMAEKKWALILAPDNQLYHVAVGDIVGINKEKIIAIDAKKITIENSVTGKEAKLLVLSHIIANKKQDKS